MSWCSRDGRILKNLIPRFQDDEEMVLAAVGSYANAPAYASSRLYIDRELVERAIEYVAVKYRDDPILSLIALNTHPINAEFISGRLRSQ